MNHYVQQVHDVHLQSILLVDDDVDVTTNLRNILTLDGYRVDIVHSAIQASNILRVNNYDVALIDVRLEAKNGINLIDEIGKQSPNLLCVTMGAYTSADSAIGALHGGAYAYLSKPIVYNELEAALKRCFDYINLRTEKLLALEALKRTHDEFEKRVAQRTAELVSANQRLEKEILERQFIQQELSMSQHALAEAQRLARIGNWRWSIVTNKLISCSKEYAHIHGVSLDQIQALMDEQFERVVHPDDRERVEREFAEFDQTEVDYEIEYRIMLPDSSVRHVIEIGEVVRDESGKAIEQVGTVQDITERKLEEQKLLEAKAQAEVANQSKSDFLALMSHELRTPLNAVLGFAQLLQSDTKTPLTSRQIPFVDHILRAGRHLLQLIDEVLDLARIESGSTQFLIEDVNPSVLLNDTADLMRSLAASRNVTIDDSIWKGPPCTIRADGTRLKQILLNLLSNAVKYNNEGGQVSLVCSSLRPGVCRISVTDTGPGIEADRINSLFEPFYRLKEHSPVEGTGIGLSITKRLVVLMKGKIGVVSKLGKGSTFWIELPCIEIFSVTP